MQQHGNDHHLQGSCVPSLVANITTFSGTFGQLIKGFGKKAPLKIQYPASDKSSRFRDFVGSRFIGSLEGTSSIGRLMAGHG